MPKSHDPRIAAELARPGSLAMPGFLAMVAAYEALAAGIDGGVKLAGHFNSPDKQSVLRLYADMAITAASPWNTFIGNPAAQREAFRTSGGSLINGLVNFWTDARHHNGFPLLSDGSFEVGVNSGDTPGDVVFSNGLIELILYRPTTKKVRAVPLLAVPPPIGKLPIMDLTKGKSWIQFMVNSGYSVYAISWVNPDNSMGDMSFEDYILKGVVAALEAIPDPKVNVAALCLGGTMAAITAALKGKVNTASFFVTYTDFSGNTGPMGAMITDKALGKMSAKNPYNEVVTAKQMRDAFRALNMLELFWGPAVQQWLLGQKPGPSALLDWNADGTNLFAKMHLQYLRACYLDNLFAKRKLVIGGQTIGISDIDVDTYWVGGELDHIVKWGSCFFGASQTSGDRRLVLAPRGHLGSIVDPPSDRASYLVGPSTYTDDASWKANAVKVSGSSWWADHANWLEPRSGPLVDAPILDPADILYAAPGKNVLVKA